MSAIPATTMNDTLLHQQVLAELRELART